jgi:transcriptional regulator with XRE-family HTH domain
MERNFDQVRQSLAHNIRLLRSQQGLSQEALALNAEVDRTYVSQIERAVGNPSLLVLCKLAAILEVDAVELLSSTGHE